MSSEVEAVKGEWEKEWERERERDREVAISSAVAAAREQWLAVQEEAIKVNIMSQ